MYAQVSAVCDCVSSLTKGEPGLKGDVGRRTIRTKSDQGYSTRLQTQQPIEAVTCTARWAYYFC